MRLFKKVNFFVKIQIKKPTEKPVLGTTIFLILQQKLF